MLTLIDNITIVLCVVGIFAISVFMSKKNTDMEAYYHANKALPWSLAVGTIAASWYGGNGTIGTVGYVTTMGLSAFFIWSIGAHLVRFPLALWVAPRISVKVNSTMTELLDRFYGRIASFIGAIVLLATCLSISEIGACGYVGVAAWNMNKFLAAAIVIAISIGLSCVGGLLGVAITDMIFFFLMIVSVAFVFPSAFYGVGGFAALDEIFSTVDPSMMTPFGGIPLGRAIVLILICINVYKDPAFYQRFTASNGPKTGKRAMLTCFSIWLSMDVCLMFTAIVIRAMDPALTVQPEVAYMQLVLSGLPPVGRGLFVFAMLGAIISTMDTYYLVGGEIVSNDIIGVLRKKPLTDKQSIFISRMPEFTHLPRFLAPRNGSAHGYDEVQNVLSCLDAENRYLTTPSSVDFYPMQGSIEDHASNLPLAVTKCRQMVDNLRYLVGMEALFASQAVDLRKSDDNGDYVHLGKGTQKAYDVLRAVVPEMKSNRSVYDDINKAYQLVLEEKFLADGE